ncbi:TIGR01244 family phosphatase [Mesorhizobium sp. M1C.F.Ca.ET.193.01.1.1]|uniref:TIGR01244 family sulfur transferase n=1 Tax=unclassified Mesorhizobium TaxID=325217 RepID=UPI000FD42C46|nr:MULTISPECIES: TIGR01244 family sulfur transferase [unclassified Mesorhizobium]TGT00378.1 TIGR01244 family phosphatase [bacterium M00.F.Ca.ET.177.01.1.1]TGQ53782.1 TIGR01244 family phosphatase [Mesorhizobium sp. M1C.F.Ca.ET.210.01.1.1]TGQ71815.1 TIGR01244 family phosphatase [Mesorhizobium sp. M1C.F.Ca.ET.212.01.1.1]TGR08556.1 TIGR01244 family phosphatase [Mesorhizobium sp. M1C.F.Ca.ET.204.01.1.1]TGR28796.1 TIGR01244 family phosphatase [Mesorhizobium sp. M1C.F.Ca.ET.196.01.1.1]
MEYRQISDVYSVSGQIQPEDIAAIKEAGFRSVICNRPDNEQPGQPSADSVKAVVEAAGLAFRYIPVISGQITMENVEDQAQALDELEGPVFAYCRSGARCTNLYGLIQQQRG